MRTENPPERGDSNGSALSRRAFVVASGTAAGTVVGSGLTDADAGSSGRVVGATDPYVPAAREAADGAGSVEVRAAGDLDGSPDVLVTGRPEPSDERHVVAGTAVDRLSRLSTPDGTWRDVLRRPDVESRWERDAPVETWSESDRADPTGVPGREAGARLDGTDASGWSTLVRGTRAYQYAEGHGGVGYYGVEREALADAGDAATAGSVPVVRLAYVHVDREASADERVSGFVDRYGVRAGDTDAVGERLVDPATRE